MKLTMKELAYISRMYEGISEISLLANLDKIEDGSTLFSLMEKEILVEDELSEEAKAIMDVVANARSCSRMFIQDRFCIVEKYVYRFNDQLILVENDDGEMVFTGIQNLSGYLEELTALMGASQLKSSTIEGVFSYDELVILLGVIDYARVYYHKAYLGEVASLLHFSEKDVLDRLKLCRETDLSQLLTRNYGIAVPKDLAWTQAWTSLSKKGCLIAAPEALELTTLTEDYRLFAKGFLIPETLMTLERLGYNPDGELITATSICVSAGLKDLLFLSLGSDDGELASVSGADMQRFVENFMSCHDV